MNAHTETTPAARVIGLADLEVGCRVLADTHMELEAAISALKDDIAMLKRKHSPVIQAALRAYAGAEHALREDVGDAPDSLFEKPRTRQFHGVKVGRQMSRSTLELMLDDPTTIALIRKHFADKAATLVQTKESPVRKALEQLPPDDLAKLGARWKPGQDEVVCKLVPTDFDKLIKALAGDLQAAEVQS